MTWRVIYTRRGAVFPSWRDFTTRADAMKYADTAAEDADTAAEDAEVIELDGEETPR